MNKYDLLCSLCGQLEFDIKVCSDIKHGYDWFEYESKNCYDIWIIIHGELKVEQSAKEFNLLPGDVYFIYPQNLYSARCVSSNCSFIFIRFDVMLGKNMRPLDNFLLHGKTKAEDIEKEKELFFNTYQLYKKGDTMSTLALKGALMILLSKIANTKAAQDSLYGDLNDKSPYLKLEKVFVFIMKNLDKPISVKSLAEHICISEKYFISLFKNATGITPYVYISQIKLKRAFVYLSEHKYSVNETAQMLGYSDQFTFSKAFKNYYGFSPSNVWRK